MSQVVKLDSRTFVAVPQLAIGAHTIDGYVFGGMPYYNPAPDSISAVTIWWKLLADPSYASLPPVTSISVETTVSGTVNPV
ncbi:hypothetical protein [Candidatus Solirubrobacter pratensis]|uniref:hypothetical protein n=1 Tax=Candidatus Solirubrobacter pratensis TaxID=1298857 RepID=UPI00048905F6|nr:hypothetical protein [Candidatus Solirubrobacter pratensis]